VTIYGHKVDRCTWCIRWDLPCGSVTHDNVLARYVPLIETTHLTADQFADRPPVVSGEPVVRNQRPRETTAAARRRADRLSLVAVLVMVACALAVILGGYALAVNATFPDSPGCGTACVPTTYAPPAAGVTGP
jgi:hypothetical protein